MPSVGGKKLPEFYCNLPQTACGLLNLLRATMFENPEGTLWTHCISITQRALEFLNESN
jgi:hypothetical protein